MISLSAQGKALYNATKTAFTDFTRVASLLGSEARTDIILVTALHEILRTPVAAFSISLGYTDFKITTEVLADLEENFMRDKPEPYKLIFLQLINLFLQAQEYLEKGTNG